MNLIHQELRELCEKFTGPGVCIVPHVEYLARGCLALLDEVELRDKTMLSYESRIQELEAQQKELLEALEPFATLIRSTLKTDRIVEYCRARVVWDKHKGERYG